MATMSPEERREALVAFLDRAYGSGDTANFDVLELDAVVAAVDAWQDAATASFVAALPQPFRGTSTAKEKTLMFLAVSLARSGLV